MDKQGYTKLCQLLVDIGVTHHSSGFSHDHLGDQLTIEIADEQDTGQGVTLYFDIDLNGDENFVCQE